MSAHKKTACLLAIALCVILAVPVALAHAESVKALTVMIYLCGSDLEREAGAATLDLGEMAQSGVDTEQVNIITMMGGSGYWWTGQDPDSNLITCQNGNDIEIVWAGDSMNMGDPDTLEKMAEDEEYEDGPTQAIDFETEMDPEKPKAIRVSQSIGGDAPALDEMMKDERGSEE